MIAAIFALALQATAPAPAPAPPPASSNAADAIGEILSHTPPDIPAPPPATAAPVVPPPASPAPAPASPSAPAPVPAVATAPPASAAPEAPPAPFVNERAQMYESGVRSTFQAREARQGPLDGRWALNDPDGKGLYMIQLADPGPGRGPVEGAWRDLAREGAVRASGFLISAERVGQDLVLKFQEDQPCVVTLTLGADGRWTGRLQGPEGTRPVVMTRS